MVAALDESQCAIAEGPCLDAISRAPFVGSGELASDSRWPRFGPLADQRFGIHSAASFRLYVGDVVLGALSLLSTSGGAFDEDTARLGTGLATLAALAASSARDGERADNLQVALTSSRVISTATGILMERRHLTEQRAFALLRDVSQRNNMKVRDIADVVVFTGALPDDSNARPR